MLEKKQVGQILLRCEVFFHSPIKMYESDKPISKRSKI